MELRVSLRLLRDEVQEFPLRHQRYEFAVRRQVRKVRDDHGGVFDLAADLGQLLVRPAQELIENSKFVHQFQGRGMNRVPAKVAQKIRMLLQDHNIHAGTRAQEPRDNSRRSPAATALPTLSLASIRRAREQALVPPPPPPPAPPDRAGPRPEPVARARPLPRRAGHSRGVAPLPFLRPKPADRPGPPAIPIATP